MLEKLEYADFLPYLDQPFHLHLEDGETLLLELIAAEQIDDRSLPDGDPARRRPFALIFRGLAGFRLPQRLYRLTHDHLGQLELFLVPIQPDQQGPRYEAIFN